MKKAIPILIIFLFFSSCIVYENKIQYNIWAKKNYKQTKSFFVSHLNRKRRFPIWIPPIFFLDLEKNIYKINIYGGYFNDNVETVTVKLKVKGMDSVYYQTDKPLILKPQKVGDSYQIFFNSGYDIKIDKKTTNLFLEIDYSFFDNYKNKQIKFKKRVPYEKVIEKGWYIMTI